MVRMKKERKPGSRVALEEEWNGIPVATPDEEQVERRMEEIGEMISRKGSLELSEIIGRRSTRQLLVVTFLALLEMARLGKVRIIQEDLFGDVRICC
jgi:segregation and condensation protein A